MSLAAGRIKTRADGRWELLRALGALTAIDPPASDGIARAVGLAPWSRTEQTQWFVLSLPPYASIHLGPEGKLGGEGADRIAGVWRALGLVPPADADHLASLLALYSELGEASEAAQGEQTRRRLQHGAAVVLWEHLWPWLPGYLDAVSDEDPAAESWARLTRRALDREATRTEPATVLPLALRTAPPPLGPEDSLENLLDAITAPIRTGFILTYADLSSCAQDLGVGLRRGERRFALKAMLEQDPGGTLAWLGGRARQSAQRHGLRRDAAAVADPSRWWADRANHTASVLDVAALRSRTDG